MSPYQEEEVLLLLRIANYGTRGIIMSANNISIIIIICCSNGFENFSGQNIDVFLGVRLL